ncbi:MAG: DUF1538 domain-containing protein [Desulfohalobiaceae bacterium]
MTGLLEFLYIWDILLNVLLAISPLVFFFLLFQVLFIGLPGQTVINLFKGILLSVLGLTLFLQGVHVGYMPVGEEMGLIMNSLEHTWLVIPIGFLLGFLATIAEPAVRILSQEVEKTSTGAIRDSFILYTLAVGVGLAVALAMAKILFGISVYHLVIPGYLLALILLGFCHPSFIAIAFDAGGVATGPMTVTFVLAVALGLAEAMEGRDPVLDGFGLIALVALAPILLLMAFGALYSKRGGQG